MGRRQDRQADEEIAAAKARLTAAGDQITRSARTALKHGALVGVVTAFGTGLALASGKARIPRSLKRADLIPKAITYAKLAREGLSIVNSLMAEKKPRRSDAQHADQREP